MRIGSFMAALAGMALFAGPVPAAALRVAPVIIELQAGEATSTINVWNAGAQPINVQVRVFRWRQVNGEEILEPTNDVVASPPMAQLAPQAENVIRVVRVAKTAITGEESYRLLVDELPDSRNLNDGTIDFVLRHSIPVFFTAPEAAAPAVSFGVTRVAGGYRVSAVNSGGRRLRVTNLVLGQPAQPIARADGLVGYVLPGATATWFVASPVAAPAGDIAVSADTEHGRLRAVARAAGD